MPSSGVGWPGSRGVVEGSPRRQAPAPGVFCVHRHKEQGNTISTVQYSPLPGDAIAAVALKYSTVECSTGCMGDESTGSTGVQIPPGIFQQRAHAAPLTLRRNPAGAPWRWGAWDSDQASGTRLPCADVAEARVYCALTLACAEELGGAGCLSGGSRWRGEW